MFKSFNIFKGKFKPKLDKPSIDNWIFKLHYCVTSFIFFIATVLVTSREYIGEHIKCYSDSVNNKEFHKVIESFCFFSSTFTVISPDFDDFGFGPPPHPGIYPYGPSARRPIRKHLYYQWVPFVLFGQGIMFCITHILWKSLENKRIGKLVSGLTYSRFAFLEKQVKIGQETILSKKEKELAIRNLRKKFFENITHQKSWTPQLIFCEILNFLNVFLQAFVINKFLGEQFYILGLKILKGNYGILDEIFPKVTKCTFHKYGASGTIENHDALCVMSLNIINEKIYVFLWFWLLLIFLLSGLLLIWRFFSICFYSKIFIFKKLIFGFQAQKLGFWQIRTVSKQFTYCDWLFLKYLSKNLDSLTFRELFCQIYEEIEDESVFIRKEESCGKID